MYCVHELHVHMYTYMCNASCEMGGFVFHTSRSICCLQLRELWFVNFSMYVFCERMRRMDNANVLHVYICTG